MRDPESSAGLPVSWQTCDNVPSWPEAGQWQHQAWCSEEQRIFLQAEWALKHLVMAVLWYHEHNISPVLSCLKCKTFRFSQDTCSRGKAFPVALGSPAVVGSGLSYVGAGPCMHVVPVEGPQSFELLWFLLKLNRGKQQQQQKTSCIFFPGGNTGRTLIGT